MFGGARARRALTINRGRWVRMRPTQDRRAAPARPDNTDTTRTAREKADDRSAAELIELWPSKFDDQTQRTVVCLCVLWWPPCCAHYANAKNNLKISLVSSFSGPSNSYTNFFNILILNQ